MPESIGTPAMTLGVVGGGQLGRMMAEAAAPLGVELIVLDPTPNPPGAAVSRDTITADFDDEEAMRELAERSDALTFEIELADPDLLERVSEAAGIPVHPSPDTLRTIEDKLVQKRELRSAGIPVPSFYAVDDPDDVRDAVAEFGSVMLKARTGGYDGRGNVPVSDPDDAPETFEAVGGSAMAESFVDFDREVSVIGVKGADEIATYPIGENVHEEEILRETIVPSRSPEGVEKRAREVARDVLELLDGRGVYGIELFEVDGNVLLNEIAPRPHNSGHWTIEGALTSQFEQHVRAVLGWPLGPTDRRATTVMANLLGDVENPETPTLHGVDRVLSADGVSLHWYGKKEVRPLRKMGHFTVVGQEASAETVLARAGTVRDALTFDP
ncbi:MAG: 5-(carboxyamino)imidazole ribonucleotide synthase [Halobacteriales archaeon]|jgi:5-(carboxyamino)imidazole ribonucleotide synthase